MLQLKRVSQITLLHSPALDDIPGIVHAFSTRRAERQDFTLGSPDGSNPLVQMNRSRFLAAAGMPGWPILKLQQTHSGVVQEMTDTRSANEPAAADAAVTQLRGATLGVQTADCVPILIADRHARAVAAVHAGWRGTAARIAWNAVRRLVEVYGVDPSDLTAVIGPHNGVCCYEVGEEVADAFRDGDAVVRKREWVKPHLDQARANRKQLLEAGIPPEQVVISSLCTQCRPDLFFSHRREGPRAGRLLSVIGIAP